MIGEYRVVRFLGAGGMGEVYHGVHAKLNRPAAIKVLNQTAADESFTSRFFNEAQLQASLHHPNVAALYDFSEINGQLFIFMEFIDGESLEDLVARRAFTVEDSLKTFQSVCDAIAFIHRNGIVHRDIKSQNIKLTADGKVKMLDFGIAKGAKSQNLTQVGGVIGTPHYLAPEQLEGQAGSPQTDIWALGVLLYEMLTGDMPFQAETLASLCLQITTAKFTAPEKLNPAVSREVSRIVARCLKSNVAERYQTVDELLEDVKRVLSGEKQTSKTAFSNLKKTFGLTDNPAPTKFVTDSPNVDFSSDSTYQSGNQSYSYETSRDESFSQSSQNADVAPRKLPVMAIAVASTFAVLLVFALIGVGFWAMNSSGGENKTPANNPSSFVANQKKMPDVKSNQAIVVSSSTSAQRRVLVDVDEGKAKVIRDGQELGSTPFNLETRDGEKVALTLRREGFEDKNVQLEITSSKQAYTFSLKQK